MLAVLALPGQAAAHLDRGYGYSHKVSNCGSSVQTFADPITAVMSGTGVSGVDRVQIILDWIVRWEKRTLDESQWFSDHGGCEQNNVRGANHPVYTLAGGVQRISRWHIRGRYQGGHPKGHNWTVMTPHRDVWQNEYTDRQGRVNCRGRDFGTVHPHGTHYVHRNAGRGSGFDRGREKLREKLAPFFTGRIAWGNTATIKQCNGQKAGSNGYVAYFHLG